MEFSFNLWPTVFPAADSWRTHLCPCVLAHAGTTLCYGLIKRSIFESVSPLARCARFVADCFDFAALKAFDWERFSCCARLTCRRVKTSPTAPSWAKLFVGNEAEPSGTSERRVGSLSMK